MKERQMSAAKKAKVNLYTALNFVIKLLELKWTII